MKEFKPPQQIEIRNKPSIFLAGSIDMGAAENWQKTIADSLTEYDIDIYNPRRSHWDSSLVQHFTEPTFYQQVSWELDALERAHIIVMNLLPNSSSPVSLLELGLYARSRKILVCCPDEFYRSGNVQITCNKFNIPMFKNMEELMTVLKEKIKHSKD